MENPNSRAPHPSASHAPDSGAPSVANSGANRTPDPVRPSRRNPIYRAAYRYFFENYGSSRLGSPEKYRSNTLIGIIAMAAGGFYAAPALRQRSDLAELIICLLFLAGGLIAVIHYAPEWRRYARLAQKFASGAVQGGLKTQAGVELAACNSVNDIPGLFEELYPWC